MKAKMMILGGMMLAMMTQAWALTSSPVRVDTRTTIGRYVATGVELVGESGGDSVREWDTTQVADGWTKVSPMWAGPAPVQVCVLNENAVVHGGRLTANEIWSADRVHVVRSNIVVPNGVTLTLETDAVVKFAPGASIATEGTGSLVVRGARCADIADDSVGGDTDMNETGSGEAHGDYEQVHTTLSDWFAGSAMPVAVNINFQEWDGPVESFTRYYTKGLTLGDLPEPSITETPLWEFKGWIVGGTSDNPEYVNGSTVVQDGMEIRTCYQQTVSSGRVSAVVANPADTNAFNETLGEISVRFALTKAYHSTLYAFLEPLDEASSNLVVCKAFDTGVAIGSGDTQSVFTAKIQLLDGSFNTLPLSYAIVLRTESDSSHGERIFTYGSENLELFVNNIAPAVTAVRMDGSMPVTVGGDTFRGRPFAGARKMFSIDADDVEADLASEIASVWTFTDPNGNSRRVSMSAPLDEIVITNVFEVAGTYSCSVKLRDKDMPENEYGETFSFNVNVRELPSVNITFIDSDTFNESDAERGRASFNVELSTPAERRIDVEIESSRIGTDGILAITNNTVTFRPGETSRQVSIEELDGTVDSVSFRGGFSVTARVVTKDLNEDGIAYRDLYLPATARMYVKNAAPTIVLPIDGDVTNDITAGVQCPIAWKVHDVDSDLTNNLTVVWTTSEGVVQTYAGSDVYEGVFTNVFTSGGYKTVTMTVTDKDGGMMSKSLLYHVREYYNLEIIQPARGGMITGATSGPQSPDSMLMLTRKADTGYHILGWTGDIDGLYQWGDSLAVVMDMPRRIGLAVAPDVYSITYADTRGAANGNPVTYTIEDEVVFAPLPDVTGWKFIGWSQASIPVGSMGAVTVTAQWVPAECSITVGGEETKVTWGSEITFRAPEPSVDELCKTQIVYVGTSFTAPVVTNEFTVIVTNDIDFTWDVLATNYWLEVCDTELGAVAGASDGWQEDGAVLELTAIPDEGCKLHRWAGDTDGCMPTGSVLYVTMDRARSIAARFSYDLTAVIDSVSPQSPDEETYMILQGHGEGGTVAERLWTAVNLANGAVSELSRASACRVRLNAGEWRLEYRVRDTTGIWSEPASQTITVSAVMPVVDLQVARTGVKFYDSIGLPTSNIETGDVVTVKVTVQNRGNANMSGRATLYLCDGILPVDDMSALTEDDPRVLATARVSRLNLGKSQTVSMTWNVGSSLSGEGLFYDEGPNAFTVVVVSDADAEAVVNNNLVTTMLELGESDIELSEIFNLSADYETSIFVGSDYSVSGRVWYERDGARVYVAGAALTFMIDGEIAGSGVTDSSGRYLWMFTAPEKGSHTISVKAVDGTVVKTYAGTFTSVERAEPDADGQPGAGGGSGGEEENPEDPVPSVKKANLKVQTFVCEGDGITGMNGNAYSVALGGEVTLDAVVKNVGQMAVTNAFTVKITDITNGDVLGCLVVTNGLAVGEELNVSIDEPFVLDKAGRYGYRIIVDEAGLVDEPSETDNEGNVWITVEEPLPNLVVTDMTFSDSQPVAGDELVIRAKVRNIGDATCPAGVKVAFNTGNSMSEIELSDELAADASADVAYSILPAEGTLKISIEADHFDEIEESSETDNGISRTIAVYSVNADVKPVSLGAEPYPKAGEPCVLTAMFRNDGGASYQGGTAVFFADDPDTGKIAEAAVGPIAWKGGVGSATCVWTPEANVDRIIGVMIDGKMHKATFSATPPPDLRVMPEDISFEPGTPSSGDAVKFRAMVRNVSGNTAAENATVLFEVASADGEFVHLTTVSVAALPAGGSVAVDADVPYVVVRGVYTVKASVMDGSGRDANLADNTASRTFGVNMPMAVAGPAVTCIAGDTVTLDGSASTGATSHFWTLVEAPPGNEIPAYTSGETARFTPQIAGLYRFTLVVSDGIHESEPAECTVLVDRVRVRSYNTREGDYFGSIDPIGKQVYLAGSRPKYTARAARGYSFGGFIVDGVSVTNVQSTYEFASLDRNHAIGASFNAIRYPINYVDIKGSENPNPATYTVEQEIVFAPLSDVEGWKFVGWQPSTIATGTIDPVTVTAKWERTVHEVTIGGVSTNVIYGTEITFRAPEPWVDDLCKTQIVYVGTSFTAPVVTTEFTVIVTNDIDFTWDILATNYWLEVSAAEGGSVDFDEGWMSAGTRKVITATPDFSYQFVRWEGDVTQSQSASAQTAVVMDRTRSLRAVFERIPITVGEAANAPDYDWYTEGDAEWSGEWTKSAADGIHAARSGKIGNSQETVLGLRLEGAGTLSFDWRASCEERYDAVRLEIDGTPVRMLSGETSWTNVCIELGNGEHDIRWVYRKGRSGTAGEDAVWVDNVTWTTAAEPTLAEALGDFAWETEGDVQWKAIRSEYAYEGNSSAMAEGLGDYGVSVIRTKVSGAGRLVFRWAVSCEESYDWFDFLVDGEVVEMVTGETNWRKVTVDLGEGEHILEWAYWKDEIDDPELVGANCAMLDHVQWYPAGEEPPELGGKELDEFFEWLKTHNQIAATATKQEAQSVFLAGTAAVGKAVPLYAEFLAGTDPEDPTSEFKAMIEFKDGLPVVSPSPDLGDARRYTVYGKKDIGDADEVWTPVCEGEEGNFNFFKVTVDMP